MNVITTYRSPLDMLYQWEAERADAVYLHQPISGQWKTFTWKQTAREVRRMAAAIKDMGLPPGSRIGLLSKNCAYWIICDLAIMMAGHITVPLYPNLTAASVNYILTHSGAVLLFVGKLDDWESMKSGVPASVRCISFPGYARTDHENWNDIAGNYEAMTGHVERRADEIGTILYTSGTTGVPKGVAHCFNSFSFTTQNAIPTLGFSTHSRFFSYLPLSHSAERSLVEMGSLYSGGQIYFCESIQAFASNLATARPTEFLAVHAIWKKIQQRILERMSQRVLSIVLRVPLLSWFIRHRIRTTIGLQHANNIIAGATPMPVELLEWFDSIGIRIQEGYGLTENWSYSHINRKDHVKFGTVGQPFPGVAVRRTETGEILVKHDGTMKEYYKDPERTAVTFTEDGFLKTDDLGEIDDEEFLTITGRVKDLFKSSKGNYVAPAPIEAHLSGHDLIDFVCVVGQHLQQPMALVVLTERGRTLATDELREVFEPVFTALNASLDSYERLSKIVVIDDHWTVDNGMLTPTMKIKRNEVEKAYSAHYEGWQAAEGFLVR